MHLISQRIGSNGAAARGEKKKQRGRGDGQISWSQNRTDQLVRGSADVVERLRADSVQELLPGHRVVHLGRRGGCRGG